MSLSLTRVHTSTTVSRPTHSRPRVLVDLPSTVGPSRVSRPQPRLRAATSRLSSSSVTVRGPLDPRSLQSSRGPTTGDPARPSASSSSLHTQPPRHSETGPTGHRGDVGRKPLRSRSPRRSEARPRPRPGRRETRRRQESGRTEKTSSSSGTGRRRHGVTGSVQETRKVRTFHPGDLGPGVCVGRSVDTPSLPSKDPGSP